MEVALLTGGFDRPYAFGLATALASDSVVVDVVGSDEVDSPEMHSTPGLRFLNFRRKNHTTPGFAQKTWRVLVYYVRLIRYVITARPTIFHILWNNKIQWFDRTFLMLYYKACGKQIAITVHNVNAGKRDGNDSLVNRLTLRAQYHLADHLFVHTAQMKRELSRDFGVSEGIISVIPFGINNSVPDTDLTPAQAKQHLGVLASEKTLLFFGAIRPYKGLEYLVEAFRRLAWGTPTYRLIIAGECKKGDERYLTDLERVLSEEPCVSRVIQKIQYIPDTETEIYFKGADVLVLPYTHIFQSGVLFLAYTFGLPVVATDVGSFRDDIIEGKTGFLCRRNCDDLALTLERYFDSELFKTLDRRRKGIQNYTRRKHSWKVVSEITREAYALLLIGGERQ